MNATELEILRRLGEGHSYKKIKKEMIEKGIYEKIYPSKITATMRKWFKCVLNTNQKRMLDLALSSLSFKHQAESNDLIIAEIRQKIL
jgi:hypothetical protein